MARSARCTVKSENSPLHEHTPCSHTTPGRGTPKAHNDRFIPNRRSMDFDLGNFLVKENSDLLTDSNKNDEYKNQLAGNLLREHDGNTRILAFKSTPPPPPEGFSENRKLLYSENFGLSPGQVKKTSRRVPQAPERTLDAPELLDDYYLNLLDWSCRNVVAVALDNTVYLWDATNSSIEELMEVNDEGPITSVAWASDGRHIAVGLTNADVQLWDTQVLRQLRSLKGHHARVGSLAWNPGAGSLLSSGGRDSAIFNHDVRMRQHITARMTAHEQEVCGLKWSPSGQQLASGGNDNILHIWDLTSATSGGASPYLHRLEDHQAAVKALAWCPFQSNLLASGGGTVDRCIKFWNTHTGTCLNSIDTQSQVCALQWNRHEKEILSSHGFSENQLCLWKYPSMVKVAELTGHTSRVLHLAQSPDGYTVASAAGDETLRFWQVFGFPQSGNRKGPRGKDQASALNHLSRIR